MSDVIGGILKEYGVNESIETWQLSMLATAISRITILTEQEALDALKLKHGDSDELIRELKHVASVPNTSLSEIQCRLAADISRLEIARAAIVEAFPGCWSNSRTYGRKAMKMLNGIRVQLDKVIAIAEECMANAEQEAS